MGEVPNNNITDSNQDVQIEISAPVDMSSISVASVVSQENNQAVVPAVNPEPQPVAAPTPENVDVQIEIDPEVTFNLTPIVNNISQANSEPSPVETPVAETPVMPVAPEPVVEQPVVPAAPAQETTPVVVTPSPVAESVETPVQDNTPIVETSVPATEPVAIPVPEPVATVEENITPVEPTMNEVNQVIDLQPVSVPEVPEPVAPPNVEGINQIANSTAQEESEELEDLSQGNTGEATSTEAPVPSDNEKLVRTYVGDKYDNLKNGKFNLAFCLLGSSYLAYRRMGCHAFLSFIIELIFLPVLPVLRIGGAFIVNGMYLKEAEKKVDQIKKANEGKTEEELNNILIKKGKPSLMNVIVVKFLYMFILIIVIAVLCTTLLASTLAKFNLILYTH